MTLLQKSHANPSLVLWSSPWVAWLCYSICCYRTLHRFGQICQIDKRQFANVCSSYYSREYKPCHTGPILYHYDQCFSLLLFHNILNEFRFVQAKVYQHKIFLGPSPLKIHTNHVKNIFCIWNSKFHRKATSLQHSFYNFTGDLRHIHYNHRLCNLVQINEKA